MQSVNSSVRQDDLECFMRIQSYRNKLFRTSSKFVTEVKWLPYSSRFDIWGDSRKMILDIKQKYNERKFAICDMVAKKIKKKLELAGVKDEKMII